MIFVLGLTLFWSVNGVAAANATNTILTTNQGSTSYGYVEKEVCGNQSSNQTVVVIVGVHPMENGIHTAVANDLESKSSSLSKRYVIYKVHVTKDASNYKKGRMNGQLLAQKFVVPDVSSENPMLVVDVHENHYKSSGYAYCRFLYLISSGDKTTSYANEIISEMSFLRIYSPPNHTSPQYVTVPIANKGIPTIIYETYTDDSSAKKVSDASAFVDALDKKVVDPSSTGKSNNANGTGNTNTSSNLTVTPAGGSYYAPQSVVLTANGLKIYYTLDNTNPTSNSTLYTAPINISTSTILKYMGVDAAMNSTPVKTEQYQIYALTQYNYTVSVPVKQVWYKGWSKVPYTVKVRHYTKVSYYYYRGHWRTKYSASYSYLTKYKWKKGWLSYWVYQNQTKEGTHWVLT